MNKINELNQFSSPAMAIQSMPPAIVVRMISVSICVMFVAMLLFAYFAHLDIIVSTQGRVIPTGKSKTIQPMESGVIKTIAVKDGQKVKQGDILIELDPTLSIADKDRLQRELWELDAEIARVQAQISGAALLRTHSEVPVDIVKNQQSILSTRYTELRTRLNSAESDILRRKADLAAITTGIAQSKKTLSLVSKKHEIRVDLAKTGHIAETALLDTGIELNAIEKDIAVQSNRLAESQAGLNSAMQQQAQISAEFKAKASAELVEAIKRKNNTYQEFAKASQRRDLQQLHAPIDGVVQQLAVTTLGGVVTQAQALMTIVPDDAGVEVEAQVANKDIGHIKLGQRVINKFETFDFTRYGYIEGQVSWVGGDAVIDQKLGPVFPIRIRLNTNKTPNVVNDKHGVISAGMTVTADIKTEERRMLAYFLMPLLRYKEESMRER